MDYVSILMVFAVAALVAGALLGIPSLIAPRRYSAIKMAPFECGKDPIALPEGRFAIKFSTIAIFFILFDIELLFVWPWATLYRRLGWFGFAAVVAGALLGLPALLAPRRLSPVKAEPFECGKDPVHVSEGKFAIKFSTIAIFFILIDIELLFIWPWAMLYRSLGWFGFVEMLVFLGVLMVGFLYIWRKGGLRWD